MVNNGKPSKVYDYATKVRDGNGAVVALKCDTCGKEIRVIKGNTSNMGKHLLSNHGIKVERINVRSYGKKKPKQVKEKHRKLEQPEEGDSTVTDLTLTTSTSAAGEIKVQEGSVALCPTTIEDDESDSDLDSSASQKWARRRNGQGVAQVLDDSFNEGDEQSGESGSIATDLRPTTSTSAAEEVKVKSDEKVQENCSKSVEPFPFDVKPSARADIPTPETSDQRVEEAEDDLDSSQDAPAGPCNHDEVSSEGAAVEVIQISIPEPSYPIHEYQIKERNASGLPVSGGPSGEPEVAMETGDHQMLTASPSKRRKKSEPDKVVDGQLPHRAVPSDVDHPPGNCSLSQEVESPHTEEDMQSSSNQLLDTSEDEMKVGQLADDAMEEDEQSGESGSSAADLRPTTSASAAEEVKVQSDEKVQENCSKSVEPFPFDVKPWWECPRTTDEMKSDLNRLNSEFFCSETRPDGVSPDFSQQDPPAAIPQQAPAFTPPVPPDLPAAVTASPSAQPGPLSEDEDV